MTNGAKGFLLKGKDGYGTVGTGLGAGTSGGHSPLGNSMRSHVLLRLVGGKELWKSMRAASSVCLENMVLIIDTFTRVFARWNLPNVSVLLGIGMC